MNRYQKLEEELRRRKCKKCHGVGHCDDAEPGDISYRTWICPDCNGTGINKKEKK